MTRFITIALALVMTGRLHAQPDSNHAYVKEIRAYTRQVDSLIAKREGTSIMRSIAEGPISAKHSVNAETQTLKGGFSIYSYETFRSDTVFLINYNDNLQKYRVEHYYLRNNVLVFASTELQDWENGPYKTLYRREEYYQPRDKDKPSISLLVKDELTDEYLWRVEYSLYKKFTQLLDQLDKKL
jgi:hypothetical protein